MVEVMQSLEGSVHLSKWGSRYARLHRNGQITYRTPGGNWVLAPEEVAATFALNGVGYWATVTRAELEARAENARMEQ